MRLPTRAAAPSRFRVALGVVMLGSSRPPDRASSLRPNRQGHRARPRCQPLQRRPPSPHRPRSQPRSPRQARPPSQPQPPRQPSRSRRRKPWCRPVPLRPRQPTSRRRRPSRRPPMRTRGRQPSWTQRKRQWSKAPASPASKPASRQSCGASGLLSLRPIGCREVFPYLLYVNGTGDVLESFDFAVRACASAGLADTGAPSGALGGFIAALLAVPTGSFLIRRCRATSTPEPGQLGRIHADTSEEIGHASCFPSLANRGVR
jgi:hypothetical protein